MSLYPDAADQAYMTRRIIDCCLREDIRGLVSQGRIAQLPEALSQYLAHEPRGNWLQIAHLGVKSCGCQWSGRIRCRSGHVQAMPGSWLRHR